MRSLVVAVLCAALTACSHPPSQIATQAPVLPVSAAEVAEVGQRCAVAIPANAQFPRRDSLLCRLDALGSRLFPSLAPDLHEQMIATAVRNAEAIDRGAITPEQAASSNEATFTAALQIMDQRRQQAYAGEMLNAQRQAAASAALSSMSNALIGIGTASPAMPAAPITCFRQGNYTTCR